MLTATRAPRRLYEPADDLGAAVIVAQRRLGGADADRADRGVAAEQRALRTARHFDGVHVVHQHGRALGARRVDAVDIDGDFRVGHFGEGGVVADAAHGDQDRALVALLVDGHRRHELGQVSDVLDLLTVQSGLAERADGDRGVLQVGLALGGGDRDFFELGARRRPAGAV
jgi:hypothetical protein